MWHALADSDAPAKQAPLRGAEPAGEWSGSCAKRGGALAVVLDRAAGQLR